MTLVAPLVIYFLLSWIIYDWDDLKVEHEMQRHVLTVETETASGHIPQIMPLSDAGNSIPQQMTSSRMVPASVKADLEHMKPAEFECSCESL